MLEFINKNNGALMVLFTAVVTLATAFYAGLTWKLVSETRKMREVQTEPKIEILPQSLDFAVNIVRLHIRNIGLGPVLNLRFTYEVASGGSFAQALLDEFTATNYFRTGLSYMGPGQERVSHYTNMVEAPEQKTESVFLFKLNYQSASGKKYCETLTIDMSEQKGTYQLGKPHLYSIAQSLERLQKDVHGVIRMNRIRADIFTSEDRSDERRLAEKQRAAATDQG